MEIKFINSILIRHLRLKISKIYNNYSIKNNLMTPLPTENIYEDDYVKQISYRIRYKYNTHIQKGITYENNY